MKKNHSTNSFSVSDIFMKNDVIHLEFINIHIDIVTDGLMVRDEKKLHFF